MDELLELTKQVVDAIRKQSWKNGGCLVIDVDEALASVNGLVTSAYSLGSLDGTRESGERALKIFDEVTAKHLVGGPQTEAVEPLRQKRSIDMFTDQQVIAALRAWWELGPGEIMPWADETERDQTKFRLASMRDMRAALEAAATFNK
jgi:hypothetical protein